MCKDKGFHFLQICDERKQSPLRRKCIASVKSVVRPGVDTYEMITIPSYTDPFRIIEAADSIRFQKAMEIENLCYIDTDCFISERVFPKVSGVPYFARYSYNDSDENTPDIFYFFVNGQCNFFKENFSKDKIHNKNSYSIPMDVLRSLVGFAFIPEMSYVHCYSTMTKLIAAQSKQTKNSTEEYTNNDLELAALKKHVEQMAMTVKLFDRLRRQ